MQHSYALAYVNDRSPVLLDMPNSGHVGLGYDNHRAADGIPGILAQLVRFEAADVREAIAYGCDAAVPEMTGFHDLCAAEMSSGIRHELARSFIDLNRSRGRMKETLLHSPLFREPMSEKAAESLLELTYDRYHTCIRELHNRILRRNEYVAQVTLRSLPPIRTVEDVAAVVPRGIYDPESAQLRLPDVFLQTNGGKTMDPAMLQKVRDALTKHDLLVQDGIGPFAGEESIPALHGNPERCVHAVCILHVTHGGIDPQRHVGGVKVNIERARRWRPAYRDVVIALGGTEPSSEEDAEE